MKPATNLAGRLSGNLRGMGCMLLSTLAFVCMHVSVRHVSEGLHPFEIAFFRNLFSFVPLLPWIYRDGLAVFRTDRIGLHGLRSVMNILAMLAFFTALTITPLVQITALSFTAPLFATVFAVLILRETIRARRIAALVIGFVGTLVILRPGLIAIDLGSALVLASAIIWAGTVMVIKVLARTESSVTITAYMALFMTPLALAPAALVWVWPDLTQLMWLLLIGIFGSVGQLLVAQALRDADTTVVMPLDFLKLIWAAALGYLVFAEIPVVWTWVGGLMIAGSASYIAYRENKLKTVRSAEAVNARKIERPPDA